jgi:hypothetical protein
MTSRDSDLGDRGDHYRANARRRAEIVTCSFGASSSPPSNASCVTSPKAP